MTLSNLIDCNAKISPGDSGPRLSLQLTSERGKVMLSDTELLALIRRLQAVDFATEQDLDAALSLLEQALPGCRTYCARRVARRVPQKRCWHRLATTFSVRQWPPRHT